MGGTSGALLEIFFRSMSTYFSSKDNYNNNNNNNIYWAEALENGVIAIKYYGGADVGMRTMLVILLLLLLLLSLSIF